MKPRMRLNIFLFIACVAMEIWPLVVESRKVDIQSRSKRLPLEGNNQLCRDKYTLAPLEEFRLRACAMCYQFLFRNALLKTAPPLHTQLTSKQINQTQIRSMEPITPDVYNETATELICETLSFYKDGCGRWKECCQTAIACCERQMSTPLPYSSDTGQGEREGQEEFCPRTWDGYSCWDDTPSHTLVHLPCPTFFEHDIPSRTADKQCTNGSWYKKDGPFGWTDYTPCIDTQNYLVGVYIAIGCYSASIIFLVPSIIIFCVFKDLLKQHRVRLHINFFMSLSLTSVVCICWYQLVHHNLFATAGRTDTILFRNPVWCRVLSFLKIYFSSTNYWWMFIEGYYLHHLLSRAFAPPKSLMALYIVGWGAPSIPAIVYSIIRATQFNEACWAKNAGYLEWIIYAPNLACMVVNLIFLCNILRILIFQLHSHPDEPSNFRRALKAVFMLVPLFGLQLFVQIYRIPQTYPTLALAFEYIHLIVSGSQGIFVSLIFCFFNGEVLTHCHNKCACFKCCVKRMRRQRCASNQMTQVTTIEDARRSPNNSTGSASPKRNGRLTANGLGKDIDLHEMGDSGAGSSTSLSKISGTQKGGYTAVPTQPMDIATSKI